MSPADSGSRTVRMRAVALPPAALGSDAAEMRLPEGMSITLEVTDGPARGRSFPLDRRLVVIGREEGEVRVPDPMISRRHASLEIHDPETIILRDLSSTNGTYHNERLIAFCKVRDGDEIHIGSTTFTVAVDLPG